MEKNQQKEENIHTPTHSHTHTRQNDMIHNIQINRTVHLTFSFLLIDLFLLIIIFLLVFAVQNWNIRPGRGAKLEKYDNVEPIYYLMN